jgi:hypothetical protein
MEDLAPAHHVDSLAGQVRSGGARYAARVGLPDNSDHTLSALPSVGVRIVAFAAICLSGLAGAIIGYSLVSLQCEGDCGAWEGVGLLVGALGAAAGMAVVAVLVMRAMGEWREIEDRERAGHGPR